MEEETPLKGMEVHPADETLVETASPVDAAPGGDADSSSESEDEADQELRIAALEAAIAANPFDYDAYVEYIPILRKLGNIEKLRLARESMNAHFPLSPTMWQEWTKDEASLSASFEGFAEIEKLFERGVSEYLSVPLWCDYLEFVEERDPLVCQCAPDGLSKMRNLFESALTAAGLHVSEGNKIWEAYREFEQAVLVTIDDNDSEEKSKQVQRIRVLFHRQLSVPSFHLGSTIKAYKHWENEQGNANDLNSELDGVPDHIASSYRKAVEMYNARAVYENQLLSCDKFDDGRRVHYMVFERSILCVFPSFKEYMDLFLVRVDGLRRRICFGGSEEDKLEYDVIRETFQRAVDYLHPQVSHHILLDLHAYWAHLEATLGKDLDAARGVWENLIKRSGSFVEVWQSYLAMEIEMGNLNEARSIYKRCYNKRFSGTGSEDICHSWLRFESKYGTLDDLDFAVKKVTPRLNELMKFKAQQDSKTALPISNNPKKRTRAKLPSEKQSTAKKPKYAEQKSVDPSYVDPTKKPATSRENGKVTAPTSPKAVDTGALNEAQSGDLKPSVSKPIIYTDECTAFISNLSYEATKGDLEEFFSDSGVTDVRILRDRDTGMSRGLAYADFSDDAHLALAIAKDGQKLHGKKLHIARSNPRQSKKKAPASSSTRGKDTQVREKVGKVAVVDSVQGPSNKVKLVGKNTFAAPRAVIRPLGWTSKNEKTDDDIEMPKSNTEFREMLLKK